MFRDDLIFLIYLYQRWIYRVDKKRANEFGYAEEQDGQDSEEEAEGEGRPAKKRAAAKQDGQKASSSAEGGASGSALREIEEEEEEQQAEGKKDK